MKDLIFKESFEWDKRLTNEAENDNNDDFLKGFFLGIALVLVTGTLLSIVNLF